MTHHTFVLLRKQMQLLNVTIVTLINCWILDVLIYFHQSLIIYTCTKKLVSTAHIEIINYYLIKLNKTLHETTAKHVKTFWMRHVMLKLFFSMKIEQNGNFFYDTVIQIGGLVNRKTRFNPPFFFIRKHLFQ